MSVASQYGCRSLSLNAVDDIRALQSKLQKIYVDTRTYIQDRVAAVPGIRNFHSMPLASGLIAQVLSSNLENGMERGVRCTEQSSRE